VDARTVAFGLTVPKPLGDRLILDAIAATGGTAIAVEDDDLVRDVRVTARLEGLYLCPEGAATVTAARELRRRGWIGADDEVVLLNTGAGVLYPDVVTADPPRVAKDGRILTARASDDRGCEA
jgi:threonine synthase